MDNASAGSFAKLSNTLGLIVKRAPDVGKSLDPYESVGDLRSGGLLRLGKSRILSRHTTDIQILCLIYVALIVVVAASLFLGEGRKEFLSWFAGATGVGVLSTLVRHSYEIGNKRLSTVDLLAGEIASIGRVFSAGNIVGAFVTLYYLTLFDTWKPVKFSDPSGKEDYFSIYEKNLDGLGPFSRTIVGDISAFYTFMKAGRDATNVVRLWTNEGYSAEQVRVDVVNIVYLCFLQMIHGRLALAELLEDEKERFRAEDIFVGIELQCFGFLCSVPETYDYRHAAISARTETYSSLATKHHYIDFFNAVCCQAGGDRSRE